MFYIPQIKKDDCGFACLKMILATINKDKNYLFLPQDEEHGYYSLNSLMKIGEKYGVTFTPFKATEKESLVNCSTFPLIAVMNAKNDTKHAVVVTKVRFKRVYFTDPSSGATSLSLSKFIENWDGTGLLIKDFSQTKCPYENLSPITIWQKVVLFSLQIVSMVAAVLGVYFINDKYKIYVPAACFVIAMVLELFMKAYSYQIMKKLDQYFFNEENTPKKNFNGYFTCFEEYKKLALASPMNYVLSLGFSLVLMVITILNDKNNALIIAMPLVLVIIHYLLINPILKKKALEINELEEVAKCSKNQNNFIEQVNTLHNKVYSYSFFVIARKYINVGLMLLTAILTMHICKISSFPYILFYLCIEIALFQSLQQTFGYNEKQEEFNKVKVRMNNALHALKENK